MSGFSEQRIIRAERQTALSGRGSVAATPTVPDIITFCLDCLGMAWLYPLQALLLKLATLQTELLTDHDREVIDEWSANFVLDAEEGRYVGREGIAPDVMDRIEICRARGRRTFRELVFVGGRRGGKTYIGAILLAYQLLYFLSLGDPQRHFGMPAWKRLSFMIFAGTREQAKANLYLDLRNLIEHSPVFEPFIAETGPRVIRLWSPRQLAEDETGDPQLAAIEISAREANVLAGRGPASPAQGYDEMAHMANRGANRSAEEIYSSATPALQQFAGDELIVCTSSPYQQLGQFHQNYGYGLDVNPDGTPASPERLVAHFSSFALYKGWERTGPNGLAMYPGGPTFPRIDRPIVDEADEELQRYKERDPTGYATEYDAEWVSSQEALLGRKQVQAIFGPYQGGVLEPQVRGTLRHDYWLHLDPAKVRDNFGAVLAHREGPHDDGYPHVVVDQFLVWSPADFPDHEVDFNVVLDRLRDVIDRFTPSRITIDQYEREFFINKLEEYVHHKALVGAVTIDKHTTSTKKFEDAMTFRRAVNMGLVHAPPHRLAEDELTYVQLRGTKVSAPESGPVQTDDLFDSLVAVVNYLLGQETYIHNALSRVRLGTVTGPPRLPPGHQVVVALSAASRRVPPVGTMRMNQGRRR